MTATGKVRISVAFFLAGCIAFQVSARGAADRDDFAQLFNAGRAAMTAGRSDEARADFEEAEVGQGGILLDEEKASLAMVHLQRATVLRPEDEVAWYRLAQAERMIGDAQARKQALAAFQK